jgi:AcrB/AcrD/AcrF family protein
MTAFATILALIPLAAGFNQGSIIAAELGTVVIGGLFSSTFLTLLVVPVVYSLVEGGKSSLRQRFGRLPEEPTPALLPAVAMAVPASGTRVAPPVGHAIPDMPIIVEPADMPALPAGATMGLPAGRRPGLIRRFLRFLLGR